MAESLSTYKLMPVTGLQVIELVRFFEGSDAAQKAFPESFLKGQEAHTARIGILQKLRTILEKYQLAKERGFVVNDFQRIALGQLVDKDSLIMGFVTASRWFRLLPQETAEKSGYTKKFYINFLNEWVNFHRDRVGIEIIRSKVKKKPFPHLDYWLPVPISFRMPGEKNPRTIEISIEQAEKALLEFVQKYQNYNDIVSFKDYEEAAGFQLLRSRTLLPTDPKKTAAALKVTSESIVNDRIRNIQNRKRQAKLDKLKEAQEARRKAQRDYKRDMTKLQIEKELIDTKNGVDLTKKMLDQFKKQDEQHLKAILGLKKELNLST